MFGDILAGEAAAMLLRHSLGFEKKTKAVSVETAVTLVIEDGHLSADLGATKPLSVSPMGTVVHASVSASPKLRTKNLSGKPS